MIAQLMLLLFFFLMFISIEYGVSHIISHLEPTHGQIIILLLLVKMNIFILFTYTAESSI